MAVMRASLNIGWTWRAAPDAPQGRFVDTTGINER
jgi:hypothetical protein